MIDVRAWHAAVVDATVTEFEHDARGVVRIVWKSDSGHVVLARQAEQPGDGSFVRYDVIVDGFHENLFAIHPNNSLDSVIQRLCARVAAVRAGIKMGLARARVTQL